MAEPELTLKQEEGILAAIPDPRDLKKMLDEEQTERSGKASRIAILLFDKEITEILTRNKEVILKGEQISIELEAKGVARELGIEPLSSETLREVAEKIQRTLVEKSFNVSCEKKAKNLWEISIQLVPSLG